MNEKALLVVSFGTSYEATRKATIDAIESSLKAAFPERALYSAWTSKKIMAKLKELTGTSPMDVTEALEAMAADGVRDVLVQPTHMMPAIEYKMVVDALNAAADKFDSITLGDALLASEEDCKKVAEALADAFPQEEAGMVVLMGHGTSDASSNQVYTTVQKCLDAMGRTDFCIATVEGTPDGAFMLEQVDKQAPKIVSLAPFMIVAGDHANNDLAGAEEDSWKSQLQAKGYATRALLSDLGENAQIRQLFVEHAQNAHAL